MNLLDAQSDRLVEYVVVVGHRNKLIPYSQSYIDDVFSNAPPLRVPPVYEDHTIESIGHEIRYKLNDFYGGPETEQNTPESKQPIHPSTPFDEYNVPGDTHPRFTTAENIQREDMSKWPQERITALINERKRIQASLTKQLQEHMFEADVLDRYPQQDSKAFPFPEGLPLFCVPKGGLSLRKSPSIPFIYYFGCTMSDGGRLYGACLSFQEEVKQAEIRGLMRRMEADTLLDPFHKEVWLGHVEDFPQNKSISPTLLRSVKDINPNQVPLEVLQKVREALNDKKDPDYDKFKVPALWTSHCLCILSHFPFLNQYRTFLTELYRLTLTPCTVPIERIISTLVDDTPLPPPGKYAVQLNVGPWVQQYLENQHKLSMINECKKAPKGTLLTNKSDVAGPTMKSDADDDQLFTDQSGRFQYISPSIIPAQFKHDLTQAIQQSFLHYIKSAANQTLERRNYVKQYGPNSLPGGANAASALISHGDPDTIPLYGFDHDPPPMDLCTVHTLSRDLLPKISHKQQNELKIQILMHQQQQAILALNEKKDNHHKDGDKKSSSGEPMSTERDEVSSPRNYQSPTDLTFSTTHDLASHYPSADLYTYNQSYPPPIHFEPIVFSRPPPNDPLRPSSIHVFPLFWNLDLEYVITIVEALLCERKVLILSDRLSLLAPICEALLLLLYPFKWFHVYVPLLPKVLNAFLNAPMPYLIGTTTNMKAVIEESGIDDHVIVYLDENRIHYQQEPPRLPQKARQKLKERLLPDVTYVKSKLPKNHFNSKYADSAFTLSALPGDLEDGMRDPDEVGSGQDNADRDAFLFSEHPAASTSSSKATHSSQQQQSAGSIHREITGKMWDAEYNMKRSFFKTWMSLFVSTSEFMVAPIDYTALSIKEHITYPLVSAKYTRVCLLPEDFKKVQTATSPPPLLDTTLSVSSQPTPLSTPANASSNESGSFFTPNRNVPPPPSLIPQGSTAPPPPPRPNRGASICTPLSPSASNIPPSSPTSSTISHPKSQPPLISFAEDDFMIVSLTHPSRSLTHSTKEPEKQQHRDNSVNTKSNIKSTASAHESLGGLEEPDDDAKPMFKHEQFIKAQSSSERPFYVEFLNTQAFSRYVDERTYLTLAHQNIYHVFYWAEQTLIKKARQGVFKSKPKPTPFLDNKTEYARQGCILVSAPLGLHRGHQHYTQYHPFYSCTCHVPGGKHSNIYNSLPPPFTTCQHQNSCIQCDCLHFAVSKDHERLLQGNSSPGGNTTPVAGSAVVSTSSDRDSGGLPSPTHGSNSLLSSNSTVGQSGAAYHTTHRNTIVHRPTLSQPSLNSLFNPPGSAPASTSSSIPSPRPTPPPLFGVAPPASSNTPTPPPPNRPSTSGPPPSLPGVANRLQNHCSLLHEVFHSASSFIKETPINYATFPRFSRNIFPDTIGRVPRLVTIDGAQVLTFLRLQMGLLMCFGCTSNHTNGVCPNDPNLLNAAQPNTTVVHSTHMLLSPYSSLVHHNQNLVDVGRVHETTLEQVIVNPGAFLGQHQHHVDVVTPKQSQQTFATHTHSHPNAIQYIPLNQGDTAYVKSKLVTLQQDVSISQEWKSLQLDKVTSMKLALMWTNVQTDITQHIIKLKSTTAAGKASQCLFIWLETIAPKLHHPLALTYSCLDVAIRDPLSYSLKHYKDWISIWHKKITIPDSTSEQIFPSLMPSASPVTSSHFNSQHSTGNLKNLRDSRPSTASSSAPTIGTIGPKFPTSEPDHKDKKKQDSDSDQGPQKTVSILPFHPAVGKKQFKNEKYQQFTQQLYQVYGGRFQDSFGNGVLRTEFTHVGDVIPKQCQQFQLLAPLHLDIMGTCFAASNPEIQRALANSVDINTRNKSDSYIPSWLKQYLDRQQQQPHHRAANIQTGYTRIKQLLIAARNVQSGIEKKTLEDPGDGDKKGSDKVKEELSKFQQDAIKQFNSHLPKTNITITAEAVNKDSKPVKGCDHVSLQTIARGWILAAIQSSVSAASTSSALATNSSSPNGEKTSTDFQSRAAMFNQSTSSSNSIAIRNTANYPSLSNAFKPPAATPASSGSFTAIKKDEPTVGSEKSGGFLSSLFSSKDKDEKRKDEPSPSPIATKAGATASGVNPPDFFDYKAILNALSKTVRGLVPSTDLSKQSTCICPSCGQSFTPYLTISNSNSSSSPITTHLFMKEKEVKIPFLPSSFIISEISKIFVQKPIQVITSPQFIVLYPELFWNIIWGLSLLQLDFSWFFEVLFKQPPPTK